MLLKNLLCLFIRIIIEMILITVKSTSFTESRAWAIVQTNRRYKKVKGHVIRSKDYEITFNLKFVGSIYYYQI